MVVISIFALRGFATLGVNLFEYLMDLHLARQPQGTCNLAKIHFAECHLCGLGVQGYFLDRSEKIGARGSHVTRRHERQC